MKNVEYCELCGKELNKRERNGKYRDYIVVATNEYGKTKRKKVTLCRACWMKLETERLSDSYLVGGKADIAQGSRIL